MSPFSKTGTSKARRKDTLAEGTEFEGDIL